MIGSGNARNTAVSGREEQRMAQNIGKKLDFLMNLTDTKNNVLARALNFDTSHISRIRSGQRGLPMHRSFLEPASGYFARHIREPYQVSGAADAICPGRQFPADEKARVELIAAWLTSDDPFIPAPGEGQEAPAPLLDEFYFGNEGKRKAAERLLTAAAEEGDGSRLFLYSDEDMSWMTEDPVFFRKWGELMSGAIKSGTRICMIHNLSRNLGELMAAVSGWIPLYLTGSIEPWYCPRLRDNIFHMTRFILSGREAVMGGYAGNDYMAAYSMYVQNRGMVKKLEEQFSSLLQICKPLMHVYTGRDADSLSGYISRFAAADGELISSVQMPQDIHYFVRDVEAMVLSPKALNAVLSTTDPMLISALKEFALRSPSPDGAADLKQMMAMFE